MTTPWPTTTIGDLFDIGGGKSVTPAARHGEPKRPFLRTANVFWGRIDLTEVDAMHFSEEELKSKTLAKGDLLVCEGGDIGRSAIWKGGLENCSFQNHLHRLRPKSSDVIPSFYMYSLQAGFTQFGIYEGAGNKTTIPNLSRNRLAALEVPKPGRDEQEKIAAVLSNVQRAIEIEEKLIATTRELRQSAMHQLFTQGLRDEQTKETALGAVPQTWQPILVADIGEIVTGTTPKTLERRHYEGGAVHFIAPGDLGYTTQIYSAAKRITESGLGVSRLLPKNSVCFVCIGSTIGKVGITTQDRSTTNQQINAIIVDDRFDPFFICYLLMQWSEYISSYSSPSPVPIMSKGKFEQVLLYISPDRDEQGEIARILRAIDAKIEIHNRKCAALQDLFKTLLHKLMAGEIRVADLKIDTSGVAIK
jgi:type I restriction enzyme S subunit